MQDCYLDVYELSCFICMWDNLTGRYYVVTPGVSSIYNGGMSVDN